MLKQLLGAAGRPPWTCCRCCCHTCTWRRLVLLPRRLLAAGTSSRAPLPLKDALRHNALPLALPVAAELLLLVGKQHQLRSFPVRLCLWQQAHLLRQPQRLAPAGMAAAAANIGQLRGMAVAASDQDYTRRCARQAPTTACRATTAALRCPAYATNTHTSTSCINIPPRSLSTHTPSYNSHPCSRPQGAWPLTWCPARPPPSCAPASPPAAPCSGRSHPCA